MKSVFARIVLSAGLLCLPLADIANAATLGTASPDGHLEVRITGDGNDALRYTVLCDGRPLIQPSQLGITVDGVDLGTAANAQNVTVVTKDDEFPVTGVHARAKVSYSDAKLTIESGTPTRKWTIEFRVFNDAVAYRYRVPGEGKRTVAGESTAWRFPAESRVWFQPYQPEYEARYQVKTLSELKPGDAIAAPALLKLPGDDGYAFVTEANLINYTDMALVPAADGVLKAVLQNDATGFELQGEIVTPWRVTLLAKDLNGLVNSDVIQSLCPPPAADLASADWIKPGRAAWHWRVTGRPKFAAQRQWVDSAAALGFEYYLVDDGWRDWKDDGRDAWAMLKDVVDYAKTKNVKIMAWVHSEYVTQAADREAYFKKARDTGLVGLKIDFMKPANVWWTQWYDDTLRDAAKFKLMIDYHGALKPTGRERTWPNELTREAIGGREQGKLSGLHDTTLPFLRLVQGHADYTPTELRAKELGGNTVAKELAQAIVYTSPLLCYSGDPKGYLASPALDVIQSIPTTWDETIVLPGSDVGEAAAFARRKGRDWYVSVINGTAPRTMPINLSFLPAGQFRATMLGDTDGDAAAFDRQEKTVSSAATLSAEMSKDGGVVVRLRPAAK